MSLIVVILFWKNCRLHSFHLYSKSMLFRHYISHFTSLYVYLLILILRIFKGTIAIITFLCLPQKAFFFLFSFDLYLQGLYLFSSGCKIIYEIHTCIFIFIFLQIRVDQFSACPPTHSFVGQCLRNSLISSLPSNPFSF